MHCPKCGVEVVEQAGFCHKCGNKICTLDEQTAVADKTESPRGELDAASQIPDDKPARSPAEKFKEAAAARQNADEEIEEDLWKGSYSPKAMIGAWMLSGLITIVLMVIWGKYAWGAAWWFVPAVLIVLLWIFQLLKLCYRRMNIRYQLTTQRFIHETGILRRVTDRIETIDMDDITFEQSFLERFVGVGTIRISSSDRTHPEIEMPGIEDVKRVAEIFDDARRVERRRRGLHIESI